MKINQNLFCIPPYISTTWNNISSIHMKGVNLMVTLEDGAIIQIPNLSKELIDQIFEYHSCFLEHEETLDKAAEQLVNAQATSSNPFLQIMTVADMGGMPFRFGMTAFDGMSQAMQHNPAQSHMSDIPYDILEKIAVIAKAIAPDDPTQTPQAEPHCNCMYCQIARTISNVFEPQAFQPENTADEEVSQKDLSFRQWDIVQQDNHLYTVTNRLDTTETYSVFLGSPVGCTCGHANCDHIVAILMS